jgi:alanine racemase
VTITRWGWAEIDLSAIGHNVRALKALTASSTLFMAVVKADGYGHGAVQVARAALDGGADRLGVATVDEALELRGTGINEPIQVLSEPPVSSVDLLLDHDIVPTVTTREFARALGRAASERMKTAAYHLKIDTGMNRIGVCAKDAPRFAAELMEVGGLALEGTLTHFATADVPGDWDFERQLEAFADALDAMKTEGVNPGIVHAANSAATILHPQSHFGMVRCGIAVYGLHPSRPTRALVELEAAMSVKARAVLVKTIGMGDGVSYGLTYHAAAPTSIATLPVGYADGVHRVLSNEMQVLVDGRRAQQVGRVCMDQLMVEVPRGCDVHVGDEFVLVGTQGSERIDIEELAERAGTINYEMACAFGMRLPRFYL